jgi:hypothetical protein
MGTGPGIGVSAAGTSSKCQIKMPGPTLPRYLPGVPWQGGTLKVPPGCYHSEESARIRVSVIALCDGDHSKLERGGAVPVPGAHRSHRKTGTLHTPHDHYLRLSRCACEISSGSDRRLLPEYASVAPSHLDTRTHGDTRGSTALLPSRTGTDALLPLALRISRIYPYSPDQLSAGAMLSCNRDRIARLNWYHT